MARINGSVSQRSDSYSFYIEWSESKASDYISTNKTTVNATGWIECSAHTAWASGLSQKLIIDGTEFTATKSVDLSPGVRVALVSGSKTITHNSDGKKSVTISASCDLPDGGGWGPAWGSASGTATLTTIPRTSKVSLSSTNFNIGSSITISTNRTSSSFTHTAVIKFNGSTVRTQKSIGASYKWDTSELYQYIPKANKGTGTVTLTTYSGSTEIGSSSVSFTANVTNSNPTFSNCTYEDTGSVSTQLTGNNQILINNYNVLKVTISTANKAVAKNSATMVKYRLVCGSKSVEASYSSTANVTLSLSFVTSMTFIVYAIDSRGNSTAVTKSVAEWKDYSDIVIKKCSAVRTDGVGKETTLTFEGTLWKTEEQLDFGAVANEITLCQYKYKKSNESEYGEPIDIVPNVSEGKFSFSSVIQGDAGAEGFNLSNSFNIQITVKDKIKTATYDILLGAGSPPIAIHPNGVSFGAPYDETQGGLIQFLANKYLSDGGAINLRNSDIINANCIWMNDEATGHEGINFLKQGASLGSTNQDDYENLRGYRGNLYYNDKKIAFLDAVYPVGSIYLSVKSTNPSSLFGGTWVAWGTGRVPVGIDTSQTEFASVEKTGGAKTHTLTASQMPKHQHRVGNYNAGGESISYTSYLPGAAGQKTGWSDNIKTDYAGSGNAHNNLQPYITCYMWKRTA